MELEGYAGTPSNQSNSTLQTLPHPHDVWVQMIFVNILYQNIFQILEID